MQSLREAGLDVIELPSDELQPDCAFVEDTAIVCNGTALMCRPHHQSRKPEVQIFTFPRLYCKDLSVSYQLIVIAIGSF